MFNTGHLVLLGVGMLLEKCALIIPSYIANSSASVSEESIEKSGTNSINKFHRTVG